MTAAKNDTKTKRVPSKAAPALRHEEKAAIPKTATKVIPAKKAASSKSKAGSSAAKSRPQQKKGGMPREGKDPKGGLTAAGRKYFEEKEGLHLKPGVKGAADTPEKKLRKGSFLRRHYANPRSPVIDPKGEPTRQALQAAAWGEPVPKNETDEKSLAKKGSALLEQYHEDKEDSPKRSGTKRKKA